MARLGRVFGDRILVRKLERPEKIRGILIPASCMKEKTREQQVWYGIIEKFGWDSKYGEAYGLKEGDIVGINDIGISNASFIGDDNQEHFWVMEEFLACKDLGRVRLHRLDKKYEGEGCGLLPLGQYSVIAPIPEEEKRGGVFIPQTKQEPSLLGNVLAVSAGELNGREIKPLNVKPDTEVLFGKYSALTAKFNDEKLLLIKEEDIIGEFEKVDAAIATGQEVAHAR